MNQVLKDRAGRVIGKIVDVGNRQYIVDVAGRRLGYFDGNIPTSQTEEGWEKAIF